jgi:hypothetical protein
MVTSTNVWQAQGDLAQATQTFKTSLKNVKTSSLQDTKKVPILNRPGEFLLLKIQRKSAYFNQDFAWYDEGSNPHG